MTDIQTILLSQLNRHLVGSELARDIDEVLIDRFRAAKQEYRSMPRAEISAETEEKRFELLNRISMLQSETFFKVSNDAALSKMIPNILIPYLIDQGATAYEARNVRDLNVLDLNLQHFQTVLDQAIGRTAKRGQARSYGIFGCIGALFAIGGLIWYGNGAGLDKSWVIPILSVPVTVALWSLIGSLAAMLYRFNQSSELEMDDPLRWLFTRPLTGMVMGMIVYLLVKGVLIISSSQIPIGTLGAQEVMWLVAFLAGFSDRFCDFVLTLIVGRLGGMATQSASTAPERRDPAAHGPSYRTVEMLGELSWRRHQVPAQPPVHPGTAAYTGHAAAPQVEPRPEATVEAEPVTVPPAHEAARESKKKSAGQSKNGKDREDGKSG